MVQWGYQLWKGGAKVFGTLVELFYSNQRVVQEQ